MLFKKNLSNSFILYIIIVTLISKSLCTKSFAYESENTQIEPLAIETLIVANNNNNSNSDDNSSVFNVDQEHNSDNATTQLSDAAPMAWLGKILDHHTWRTEHLRNLNEPCEHNLADYLRNLHNGAPWALKMNDASGRYNGLLFFGNDFWLGSKTLCWELENPISNNVLPPFGTQFFIAKLKIEWHPEDTLQHRLLLVGLCLPKSCQRDDVEHVLQHSINLVGMDRSNNTSLRLLGIRPVPGAYDIFSDIKFHIVLGFAFATLILILVSTIYEWTIDRRNKAAAETDSQLENVVNNNTAEIKNHDGVISMVNGIKNLKNGSVSNEGHNNGHKNKLGRDIASQLLLCFSALSNGKKILSMDRPSADAINCVHGLRFLSLGWVIMVHTYLQVFGNASNKTLRTITERNFTYQTISNATFSVDTFFFISGLLLTLLYLRNDDKQKQLKLQLANSSDKENRTSKSNGEKEESFQSSMRSGTMKFMMLLLYRFVRLTPAYLFVLGMNEVAVRWIKDTSVFEAAGVFDHINCDKYWWRNALYLNNLYPLSEMCMIWTWYMANDTQFYVVGIILLLIGVKHFKFATATLGVFLVSSWLTTFSIAYYYDYKARIEEPFALFDELYDKPWARIGPYFVGMITAYLLFKTKCKIQMSPLTVILGWVLSLSCMGSLVYGLGRTGLVVPSSAFYVAFGHTAWGIGIAWITVACCTGNGGPINSLLSYRGMLPLSRLTYCAYLVHPMIMVITSNQMDGPIHLHTGMVFTVVCGNIVVSFLLSLCISLAFEAPAVRLLQICTGARRKDE